MSIQQQIEILTSLVEVKSDLLNSLVNEQVSNAEGEELANQALAFVEKIGKCTPSYCLYSICNEGSLDTFPNDVVQPSPIHSFNYPPDFPLPEEPFFSSETINVGGV